MPAPDRALSPALAQTLVVVMTDPCPTVDSVRERCGLASKQTAHERLVRLRKLGLVTWEDGRKGTLRAAVTALPVKHPGE